MVFRLRIGIFVGIALQALGDGVLAPVALAASRAEPSRMIFSRCETHRNRAPAMPESIRDHFKRRAWHTIVVALTLLSLDAPRVDAA